MSFFPRHHLKATFLQSTSPTPALYQNKYLIGQLSSLGSLSHGPPSRREQVSGGTACMWIIPLLKYLSTETHIPLLLSWAIFLIGTLERDARFPRPRDLHGREQPVQDDDSHPSATKIFGKYSWLCGGEELSVDSYVYTRHVGATVQREFFGIYFCLGPIRLPLRSALVVGDCLGVDPWVAQPAKATSYNILSSWQCKSFKCVHALSVISTVNCLSFRCAQWIR